MKLKVLADNNTFIDMYYLGEPAVSYYIIDNDKKILFDTGYSDVFLRNAEKMGIDLRQTDMVVLSHGHNDHSGGLRHLLEEGGSFELLCHPEALEYKEDENGLFIGSPLSAEELQGRCILRMSDQPIQISDHLYYLGQIEEILPFEKRYAIGRKVCKGIRRPDRILDDTALAYKGKDGLFIITGCSHSGICNIIETAKKVCKEDRIAGVIGGFHLFETDERLAQTIAYLKKQNIGKLYPCHCVSLEAKIEMGRQMKIHEVGSGLELEIE